MKKNLPVFPLLAAAAMVATAVLSAEAKAPKAKITPAQAEAAATKKIQGKATSAKYEFEDGHWQYAVLVENKTGLYEVEVNATTGKVMDTERTTPDEEEREAAADKAAAAKAAHHHRVK
jgi:hypothetical protein